MTGYRLYRLEDTGHRKAARVRTTLSEMESLFFLVVDPPHHREEKEIRRP